MENEDTAISANHEIVVKQLASAHRALNPKATMRYCRLACQTAHGLANMHMAQWRLGEMPQAEAEMAMGELADLTQQAVAMADNIITKNGWQTLRAQGMLIGAYAEGIVSRRAAVLNGGKVST